MGLGMRRAALVLMLVALSMSGCGKKGPPVAPERRLPGPVSELTAVVEGPAIAMAWINPTRRADGTRLKDLAQIRVHRREEAGEGEPKPALLSWGTVVGYEQVAAIRLADPAPARVEGSRVAWRDAERLAFGRRYVYTLTAVDARGRSSVPSRPLAVRFVPAPRPPAGLTAAPGENEVRLAWSPPDRLVDGSPAAPVRYEVLRGPAAAGPLAPVTPEPIATPGFTDRGLRNDETYYYAVRAVAGDPPGSVRSELSAVAAATPVDLTPPAPPRRLVAVPSEDAVRLAWNASPEPDVAGYLVYRAEGPTAPFLPLTSSPVRTTTYVDRAVERGRAYRYAVTAVDRASRPNESARSEPVTAAVP